MQRMRQMGSENNDLYAYIKSGIINDAMNHEILSEEDYEQAIEDLIRLRDDRESSEETERLYRECKLKITKHFLRFIVSVASRYKVKSHLYGELISEGFIGFDQALDKFDGSTRLTTYAFYWIRQKIQRFLQDNIIYHPTYLYDRGKVNQNNVLELDSLNIEGKPYEFLEDTTPLPDETVNGLKEGNIIANAMSRLNERQKTVLTLRYGLGNTEEHTLEEISKKLGVTRERIRQIENKALEVMEPLIRRRYLYPKQYTNTDTNWRKYPARTCYKPESKKNPCDICGMNVKKNETYFDQGKKIAHVRCVTGVDEIPKDAKRKNTTKKSLQNHKVINGGPITNEHKN